MSFGYSPNSVSTLRGFLTVGATAGALSGLTLVCGILPVNFRIKWLSWNLDTRFDRAGSHRVCVWVCVCVRVLGSIWARHFTCKFPYRVVLVKFWHAFRLRRLAQNVCPCSGLILGLKCVLLGASFLSELVSFLVEFRIESGLASSL